MMRKKLIYFCVLSMTLLLTNCAVYKIDIRQGNLVTQEMLDRLELNMSTDKVRLIMGTPLLIDVFHQNRWDYLYSFQPGGGQRTQRHISLYFNNNQRLAKIDGDVKIGKPRPEKPESPSDLEQEPIL